MTSQLLFSNVYFTLLAMVDSHQIFLSPMATPLSRSSVASTAPESPIRSSTKIIRSSSSPWATSNLKATYESLRSPAPTTPTSLSSLTLMRMMVVQSLPGAQSMTRPSKHYATATQVPSTPPPWSVWDSKYHSIVKILATFRASSLPVQRTQYTMDLFDPSDDLTLVDEKIYQKLVGMLIWTLKLRFETQLAVIMACFHNSNPTQGDQTKVICLLAYFSGCQDLGPTWFTTEGPILVASCDAAFAVHPITGGS